MTTAPAPVFINYSRKDRDVAERIRQILENAGIPTWIDTRDIRAGDDWEQALRDAVQRCAAMVVVMTDDARQSEWVQRELEWAVAANKRIVPVLVRGEVWSNLRHLQALDATDGTIPEQSLFAAISGSTTPATPPQSRPPRRLTEVPSTGDDDESLDSSSIGNAGPLTKRLQRQPRPPVPDLPRSDVERPSQPAPARTGHLYISYPYRDGQETAKRLQEALDKSGYTTWRDVTDIPELGSAGYASEEAFWTEAERAMQEADRLLAIITPAVSDNPNSGVRGEIAIALRLGVPIIPLRLKGATLPIMIADEEPIDFDNFEEGLKRLLMELEPAAALRTDDYRAIPDPDDLPNVNLDNVGNVSNSLAPRNKAAPQQQQQQAPPPPPSPLPPRRGHLYISYPYRDGQDTAKRLQEALDRNGYTTWRDVTNIQGLGSEGYASEEAFRAESARAMLEAAYLLAIVSPAVSGNPNSGVQHEIIYALSSNIPTILLRLKGALPPVSAVIANCELIDFDNFDDGLTRLLEILPPAPALRTDDYRAIPDPDDLPNVNLDNVGNVSNSLAPRKKAAPQQQQQVQRQQVQQPPKPPSRWQDTPIREIGAHQSRERIYCVRPDTTLADAYPEMAYRVGHLVVTETGESGGRLLGLLSLRQINRRQALDTDLSRTPVSEVMQVINSPDYTVHQDDTILAVLRAFNRAHVPQVGVGRVYYMGTLPLIDDDFNAVGVVSYRDVLRAMADGVLPIPQGTVADWMHLPDSIAIGTPDMRFPEASLMLARSGQWDMPIADASGGLIGVLTDRAIVENLGSSEAIDGYLLPVERAMVVYVETPLREVVILLAGRRGGEIVVLRRANDPTIAGLIDYRRVFAALLELVEGETPRFGPRPVRGGQVQGGQPQEAIPTPTPALVPDIIASGTPVRVGARELAVTAIMQREDEAVLVLYGGFTNRDAEVVAENGDLIGEIIEQSSGFSIARLRGTRSYSAALPNGEPLRGVDDWAVPRPLVSSTTGEDITITRMADRYESDQRWAWTVGQLDRFTGLPEGTLLLDREDGRASAVLVGGAANLKTAMGDNYVPLSWAVDDFGLSVIDDVSPFPAADSSLPVVEEPLPLDPAEIHIGTPCRVGDQELVVSAMVMQGKQARLLLVADAPVGTRVYATNGDLIGEIIAQQTYFAVAKLVGSRTFAAVLPNGHPLEGLRTLAPFQVQDLTISTTQERVQITQTPLRITTDITSRSAIGSRISSQAPIERFGYVSAPRGDVPMGSLLLESGTRRASVISLSRADGAEMTIVPLEWALQDFQLTLITTPDRYKVKQTAADTLRATRDRIGVDDEDRLGVTPYVTAFERLVRDTDPPLTVGIYGKWGSGKTFIMNQVALRLNPTWKRKAKDQRRKVISLPRLRVAHLPTDLHPLIVWFEAWDYIVTDKLWSGLLERVFHELENAEGIDAWQQFRLNVKRNWERQRLRGRARLWPLVIAAGLAAVVVGSLSQILETTLAQVGGLTVVGAATLIGLANTLLTSASQRVSELFTSADYRNDLNFMGNIRDDLQAFAASLPNGMKVAVFIDDLDRCDPKKAVEVLEAVKLLLDFDHSPFMVFMGLDARIITQAIEQHYGEVLSEARITGYEYLDKIVQIPFSIPEPRPEDLRDYLGSLVNLGKHETRSANGSQPPTPIDVPPAPDAAPPPPPPIATPFVASEPDLSANNIGLPTMNMTAQNVSPRPFTPPPPTDLPQTEYVQEAVDEPAPLPPAPIMQGPAYSQREADFFDDEVSQEMEEEVVQQVVDEPAPEPEAPAAPPSPQELEDTVAFTAPEQAAFMSFNPHIDPNPRRIKRLVNVYRLVRVLLKVQPPDVPLDPSQQAMWVMGWLTLCEQWPYAAHCLLETLPAMSPHDKLPTLYEAAQGLIGDARAEQLRRLDLEYDRLAAMIEDRLADMTCEHLVGLRRYTVNFNPALSAEVRLTLMMAE